MRENSFVPRLLALSVVCGAMILANGCGGNQEQETIAVEEEPMDKAKASMDYMKEQMKKNQR